MACTPLAIDSGLFIPITPWSTAATQSAGGVTVTRNAGGPNPGITVTGPTGSIFHQTLGSNVSKYLLFGDDHNVLILESQTGPGPVSRNVSIVDFTGAAPVEKSVFLSTSSSTAVNEPVVHRSQGNGKAFLIWSSSGTQIQNLSIRRSDTGDVLCAGPPPFVATGQTTAEATATDLIIHYSSGGTSKTATCAKPLGECKVTPSSQTFPDAVVGGAPTLATTTDTFTIKNEGDDCMTINAIGNVAPFSVSSTSKSLPAELAKNESMNVEVTFAPLAVGNFGPTNLPITRTPANGDNALVCQGEGRAPVVDIGFSPSALSFGKVPVGTPSSKTLTIQNNGETGLNVSLAGSSPASPFQWPAFSGNIPYGGNQSINVIFTPTAEGAANATMSVSSNDPASPHSINMTGEGCIANAAIDVPPTTPIAFGQIQRGFRTVRTITIKNTGDGQLTFKARIAGADAALFGLQPPSGSVTTVQPQRNYAVDPVSACGSLTTGSGETIVAVTFHANDAPAMKGAQLIIEDHNATNTAIPSWSFPLSAEIIPLVAVDAALVLDRSGSMSEASGGRVKSEAEISAGRLFTQLARPGVEDRLAFVKFNDVPNVFQPIVAVTSGNQATLVGKINSTELAPSGSTSIAGGVMMGLDELAKPRPTLPPELNKALIVVTDGKDNTAYQNPSDSKWYSLLGGEETKPGGGTVNTDPLPTPSDVKIYAVGLGNEENIDKGRLDILSQATGAYFGVVGALTGQNYFDLEKYFTQIYMDAVDMATIMDPVYTILPGERHEIEFDLLKGDVGALVVIFDHQGMRLPFYLKSPMGELVDLSTVPPGFQLRPGWTDTARFVEFRVPQGEPDRYTGRWKAVIEHNGEVCFGSPQQDGPSTDRTLEHSMFVMEKCREWDKPVDYGIAIGAGSNFRMQPFVTPGIVHTGEPILLTAVVAEAGLPVMDCAVTVHAISPGGTTWNLTLLDDGAHDDADPDDGEYARSFTQTAEAGSYQFTFRATGYTREGEPVVREAVRAKYVEGREPIEPRRPDGSGDPSKELAECCKRLFRLLLAFLLIVFLLAVIFWFRLG